MSWHLILMITFSILYIGWKIYVFSTSLHFNYWTKKYVEYSKYKWILINIKRRIKEFKVIIKKYFEWYGFKHFWPIIISWLIYGGIFIW